MPNPYRLLHEEAGLWPISELPSKPLARVLQHLAVVGEPSPRLYSDGDVREYGVYGSLSNNAHAAGWSTNCSLWPLGHGTDAHDWKSWVELDKDATAQLRPRSRWKLVYKITNAGREALAQFVARDLWEKRSIEIAKQILAESRLATGARPKK